MYFPALLQQSAPPNQLLSFLPLVFIVAIFYFLVFMPMQKQKKQQAEMLRALQNGDVVLTTGGLVGTIVKLLDDSLIIRVEPDNVKLKVARSAVSGKVGDPVPAKQS